MLVLAYHYCSRGEMDITSVFGTAVLGSNPGGSTKIENEVSNFLLPQKANLLSFRQDSKVRSMLPIS